MSLKLNPITGKLDKVVKTTTTLGTPGVDTQVPTEKAVRAAISGAGFSDPMTTRGDIIHKNAAGTTTRLGSGTVGQVLTSDGTDISWAASAGGVDTSGTPVANDFARFTDADTIEGRSYTEVRSDLNVEDGADVTDTANVTAAGALMDSEVDADIKTLVLPASTTISAFGKTLVDDAAAVNARTTLDVDQAGTDNSTDVTIGTANGLSLASQALSLAAATASVPGAATATQITKLDGIQAGATANVGDFLADGSVPMTGRLDLVTGTTTVAPIKMTAGVNLTTPVAGVMEWDGTDLFFSI